MWRAPASVNAALVIATPPYRPAATPVASRCFQASGAKSDRVALAKVIAALDTGDVLVVTRLDRLARSTRDLLNTLDAIARKGAAFRSLADTWADTTTALCCCGSGHRRSESWVK